MTHPTLPRRALIALACASCLAAAVPAMAQGFPQRPVRIIVPFATGGGSDVLARAVGQKLSMRWKQPVIVENKPGAGGALGADYVAKSPADGYTLLVSDSSAVTMNPFLYPKLPYAAKDLLPVVHLATFSLVLLVPANSPANKVADLVAMDKAKPGSLSGASAGAGTSPHLVLEMFNAAAGTRIVHVPYKGGGPAMVDVIGGQVDLIFNGLSANTTPMITNGKVKALAVTTPTRVASLPNVPTMAESGFPGFEALSAQTLFVPAGTPATIVHQMNQEVARILREPDIVEQWNKAGYLPVTEQSPEQLSTWFARESAKWSRLIHERNIRVD
jgi:tripartite-type tricarboxylate transporter receptor subunit TctC